MTESNEPTVGMHCRIPESTYKRAKALCGGAHGLGNFVNEALKAYMNRSTEPSINALAEAMLRKLKEKL